MRRMAAVVAVLLVGAWSEGHAAPGRGRKGPSKLEKRAASGPEAEAEALYNAGRYAEAARAFAALAGDPKFAFYEGLALEALGHDAEAILRWRALLGPGLEAGLRAKLEARLAAAQRRTTQVRGRVTQAEVAGAEAVIEREGAAERPSLRVPLAVLEEGVFLDPGAWVIRVPSRREDHEDGTARVTLAVEKPQMSIEISLAPKLETVTLTFAPRSALRAGITLTLTDPSGLTAPQAVRVRGHEVPLRLRVGTWKFRAEAPRHTGVEGGIAARKGGTGIAVTLRRTPRKRSELQPLAIGAGVTGALLAVGGAVGLGVTYHERESFQRDGDFEYYQLPSPVIRRVDMIDAERGLIGASLGFFVAAVTAASRSAKVRRRLWIAETAVGTALAGVGTALFVVATGEFQPALAEAHENNKLDRVALKEYMHMASPGTVLLGAGVGLVAASIVGLLLERSLVRARRSYARHVRGVFPLILSY